MVNDPMFQWVVGIPLFIMFALCGGIFIYEWYTNRNRK